MPTPVSKAFPSVALRGPKKRKNALKNGDKTKNPHKFLNKYLGECRFLRTFARVNNNPRGNAKLPHSCNTNTNDARESNDFSYKLELI